MNTTIIGNSIESFLLNFAISGIKGQSSSVVCPTSYAGRVPQVGIRQTTDTPFMRAVLDELEVFYDLESEDEDDKMYEAGVLRKHGDGFKVEALGDNPKSRVAFDDQELLDALVEFASPECLNSAAVTDLNWDPETQESDVCLRHTVGGKKEYKVFESDAIVLDCSIGGPACPNTSFRNDFQVVRIQDPELIGVRHGDFARYDVVHVCPELESCIDQIHYRGGSLATVLVRGARAMSEIQDALNQFVCDAEIYDWNTRLVSLPHLMSVCKPKSSAFVPWEVSDLSQIESLAMEVCK